ncbi:hypothetical protein Tco_0728548 [Tanacetum coccineum]|uniref:Uncharacterized protein n=1 Tax=Tanacetum coccineum TaxID=301880 RepID=A0ABQ4YP38_9ASTR
MSSAWKTYDTREAPSSSSQQKTAPQSEYPVDDIPIPDVEHISDSEYTYVAHLPKIKTRPNWKSKLSKADLEGPAYKVVRAFHLNNISLQFQMEECIKERRSALSISKRKAANYPDFGLKELVPSLWIESEREYDISAAHGRSYMRILSVVGLKTISRYGYTYLKEIVLHRVDYNEYKILESNFQNLHPNDFEDLYLLYLQGKLNHLFGSDKTKLNLTDSNWDASDFLFKEDYIIFSKPRAVIYKDRHDQKMMMMESKVHKFSDGTLTRILERLDHMVKDFRLFKYNPGMEKRIWSEDDRRRSKEFMEVIKRRLKIRRIFRSLESYVSGRRTVRIKSFLMLFGVTAALIDVNATQSK